MTAQLTALIEGPDNAELVRDNIAAILLVEQAGQQVIALAQNKDPELWRLRVFLERSNPWDEYLGSSSPAQKVDAAPIVNVRWEAAEDDAKASNVVARQKSTGTFFVDCYGYGVSRDTDDGHLSGDELAAREAQRAARLVRRILMAGRYTYLGMRGTVSRRWRAKAQAFEPPMDQRPAQHVQGVRVSMQVDFNEFSPQIEGAILDRIDVSVRRADNGEIVLFEASYTPAVP